MTYSDEQKQALIQEEVRKIYPQLLINCKKVCGAGYNQWGADLLSFQIEYFYNMDIDKQWKIVFEDKKLENYMTSSMRLGLHSSSSPFYVKIRKPMLSSRELIGEYDYKVDKTDTDEEDKLNFITKYIEELNFYDKALIQAHYVNNETIRDMSIRLGILDTTLKKDIRRVLKDLKNKIENEQYSK
jgi:hypothetical protein